MNCLPMSSLPLSHANRRVECGRYVCSVPARSVRRPHAQLRLSPLPRATCGVEDLPRRLPMMSYLRRDRQRTRPATSADAIPIMESRSCLRKCRQFRIRSCFNRATLEMLIGVDQPAGIYELRCCEVHGRERCYPERGELLGTWFTARCVLVWDRPNGSNGSAGG